MPSTACVNHWMIQLGIEVLTGITGTTMTVLPSKRVAFPSFFSMQFLAVDSRDAVLRGFGEDFFV